MYSYFAWFWGTDIPRKSWGLIVELYVKETPCGEFQNCHGLIKKPSQLYFKVILTVRKMSLTKKLDQNICWKMDSTSLPGVSLNCYQDLCLP